MTNATRQDAHRARRKEAGDTLIRQYVPTPIKAAVLALIAKAVAEHKDAKPCE